MAAATPPPTPSARATPTRSRRPYGEEAGAEEADLDAADDAAAAEDKGFVDEYYHGEVREGGGEQDENTPQTGEQFLLGPNLLVQPITTIAPIAETRVYLPASDPTATAAWYDLHTAARYTSTPEARVATVPVHPDRVPAFVRGGAILPRRERQRRSSAGTHTDPFTLVVAPDALAGAAAGSLFVDRYDGFEDASLTAHFRLEGSAAGGAGVVAHGKTFGAVLSGEVTHVGAAGAPPAASSPIERIVLLGQTAARDVVVFHNGAPVPGVTSLYDAAAGTLTVRQPKVAIGERWTVGIGPTA